MHTTATLAEVDGEPADDEASLIAAAQRDPRAFAPLYERYAARVYRYLRARTPSDDDAADLTQQVFLQALAALPRYRHGRTPFAAWLFRIARNIATDAHRRRRPTVELGLVPETLQGLGYDTEKTVLQREALHDLHSLLQRLEPEKREVVILRFMAGLTAREVADVIGKSEAAVHKQLARTLHQLKEQYHAC